MHDPAKINGPSLTPFKEHGLSPVERQMATRTHSLSSQHSQLYNLIYCTALPPPLLPIYRHWKYDPQFQNRFLYFKYIVHDCLAALTTSPCSACGAYAMVVQKKKTAQCMITLQQHALILYLYTALVVFTFFGCTSVQCIRFF